MYRRLECAVAERDDLAADLGPFGEVFALNQKIEARFGRINKRGLLGLRFGLLFDGQHPRQAFADAYAMRRRKLSRLAIDAIDGQLARAFPGCEKKFSVGVDVEGARRFFSRRLPERGQAAVLGVDGETGEAIMAAIRHPHELAAGMHLHFRGRILAGKISRQRGHRLIRRQTRLFVEAISGDAAALFIGGEGDILLGMKRQMPRPRLGSAARRLASFLQLAGRRIQPELIDGVRRHVRHEHKGLPGSVIVLCAVFVVSTVWTAGAWMMPSSPNRCTTTLPAI